MAFKYKDLAKAVLAGEIAGSTVEWVCPICGKTYPNDRIKDAVRCVISHADSTETAVPSEDNLESMVDRISTGIYDEYVSAIVGDYRAIPVIVDLGNGKHTFAKPEEFQEWLTETIEGKTKWFSLHGMMYKVVPWVVGMLIAFAVYSGTTAAASSRDLVGEFIVLALLGCYTYLYRAGRKNGEVLLVPLTAFDTIIIMVISAVLFVLTGGMGGA